MTLKELIHSRREALSRVPTLPLWQVYPQGPFKAQWVDESGYYGLKVTLPDQSFTLHPDHARNLAKWILDTLGGA